MSGARLRLLYADDNALDLERIERLARRLEQVPQLHTAGDGVELLERLEAVCCNGDALPDAVLLDINMPRLDGLDTLAAIRADARFRHLFVGIITTSMRSSDHVRAAELDANVYLVKPLTDAVLADTLDAVRRHRSRA